MGLVEADDWTCACRWTLPLMASACEAATAGDMRWGSTPEDLLMQAECPCHAACSRLVRTERGIRGAVSRHQGRANAPGEREQEGQLRSSGRHVCRWCTVWGGLRLQQGVQQGQRSAHAAGRTDGQRCAALVPDRQRRLRVPGAATASWQGTGWRRPQLGIPGAWVCTANAGPTKLQAAARTSRTGAAGCWQRMQAGPPASWRPWPAGRRRPAAWR